MIVFINVACGAGSMSPPKPDFPNSVNVAATAQHAVAAPMSCPNCCFAGVAPTRKPVLRSCEMSPDLLAAMATIVPTVKTATCDFISVQPAARKQSGGAQERHQRDAEVGCEETPTMPTIRAVTVTKSIPKRAMPNIETNRGMKPRSAASRPGTSTAASAYGGNRQDDEYARQVAIGAGANVFITLRVMFVTTRSMMFDIPRSVMNTSHPASDR